MSDAVNETEKVPPALTPEEWARIEAGEPAEVVYTDAYTSRDANGRHIRAALALHGEMFGFHHMDVSMLREEARSRAHLLDPDALVVASHMAWLADRIAALLPPADHA